MRSPLPGRPRKVAADLREEAAGIRGVKLPMLEPG